MLLVQFVREMAGCFILIIQVRLETLRQEWHFSETLSTETIQTWIEVR